VHLVAFYYKKILTYISVEFSSPSRQNDKAAL